MNIHGVNSTLQVESEMVIPAELRLLERLIHDATISALRNMQIQMR